ncbi:MAG TPA: 2,3-bisphosphoglycerate-independent phosphoglycerate mutase, partial [Phycisphaerae bacterium]|nr:2,3-bisphosphoglycerate-independent phosphoglycerate mutase [Phycisphaerae bacterium]
KNSESQLHLIGLCSDGGVHSHLDHLFALLEMAKRSGLNTVLVHCITDGRDTSPTSGVDYISLVQNRLDELGVGRIASVVGRYYAMDRDSRWDRVQKAYEAIVDGKGVVAKNAVDAVKQWYSEGKTDEFIPPTVITTDDPDAVLSQFSDDDGVVFFNFRSDRARQITRSLTEIDFAEFDRRMYIPVHYVCMTVYDDSFDLPIIFHPSTLENTLSEVLAQQGLSQLRIAETEKYAHVTFFFSGGVEQPVTGEDRCLLPSPKVATYDLKPEMSAFEVTNEVVKRIESGKYDVVILNFANADMVGHTGILAAAVQAVEVVDQCVGKVLEAVKNAGGSALITADHGNAEKTIADDGDPFTAHSINPVHLIYVGADSDVKKMKPGILADVAPTILAQLGIEKPKEMTGNSLLVDKE